MLKPALLYKDEILRKFAERVYTDDYCYYMSGPDGAVMPKITDDDYHQFQYAIVEPAKEWELVGTTDNPTFLPSTSETVIGYFTYRRDTYTDTIQDIGLMSFDKGNILVGLSVLRKMRELVKLHHRVTWSVVEGNPAKPIYDRFCRRYGGIIHHFRECAKDKYNKYVDSYTYEIVNAVETRNSTQSSSLREVEYFIVWMHSLISDKLIPLKLFTDRDAAALFADRLTRGSHEMATYHTVGYKSGLEATLFRGDNE